VRFPDIGIDLRADAARGNYEAPHCCDKLDITCTLGLAGNKSLNCPSASTQIDA
jgi:hypothetical protein